jgi:thiosulfate dehydrogenase (quinone) large subunit
MTDTNVQTLEEKGRQGKFRHRDLPIAYLMVRATMGFHMIAHGGVRLPILSQFAAETTKNFTGVTLLGLPLFPDWLVTIICYAIPPVEFVIGLLLAVGFKTRLACIAGNLLLLVMMFGTVAQKNFATAHVMWWYVLIFAVLGALNFADRYSLDRLNRR